MNGDLVDEYNSCPDLFDFRGEHIPPRPPIGGDAELLCSSFGVSCVDEIEKLLREDDHCDEPYRHFELARLLEIPTFVAGFSWGRLKSRPNNGGLPEYPGQQLVSPDDLHWTREASDSA